MKPILMNHALWQALATIIELPPNVVELDLSMRWNETPTLTLKTYVVGPDGKPELDRGAMDLKRETRTFRLVEVQHFADASALDDEAQRLVRVAPPP
jgi:hypothetical protein